MTTIVFGAFPLFITFTLTTLTTVVLVLVPLPLLIADEVVIIGFIDDAANDEDGISDVLVMEDDADVVGIFGTFLSSFGDV